MSAVETGRPLVPPGFPWRVMLLLLAAALVLRLGTNLTRVDETHQEGLEHGTHAQALLLDDVSLWPAYAPREIHWRNTVLVSWLAAPFFALFGPTTFALRCAAIVMNLATLVAFMLLVHRQFGRRAAVLAGALFTFAPPAVARMSVLAYGDHLESLLFILPAALLVLRWLDDATGRLSGIAFAAGLCSGLAFSYHLQSRIGFLALALTVLLAAPRRMLRRDTWIAYLPGLLAGLSPLVIATWLTGRDGLTLYGESHAEQLASGLDRNPALKWWLLWWRDVPDAFQYGERALGAATWLLALACLAGLAAVTWRACRAGRLTPGAMFRRVGFFVVYPLLFSVPYATSRYRIDVDLGNAIPVRLLMPFVPILMLPIAVAAARLAEYGRRGAALAIAGPALLLGAYGSLSTWNLEAIRKEPARSAVVWERGGPHFEYSALSPDDRARLRRVERATWGKPDQDAVLAMLLRNSLDRNRWCDLVDRHDNGPAWTRPLRYRILDLAPRVLDAPTPAAMVALWRSRPARLRPYIGADAVTRLGEGLPQRKAFLDALLVAGRDEDERLLLWHAFGGALVASSRIRTFDGAVLWAALDRAPAAVDRRELAFGFGFRTGQFVSEFFGPSWRHPEEFLAHAPPAVHAAFARGFGAGYRLRFLQPPPADLAAPSINVLLAHLPPALEAPFREGLGGATRKGE